MKAFKQLKTFATRVDEADHFDEEHLLPIALEVFGSMPKQISGCEIIPLHAKGGRSRERMGK